jgi:hypothetical protein
MNKLIVETKNAPMKSVVAVLATWSKLAELVEENATLPKGCELEWELVFQRVCRSSGWSVSKSAGYWESATAVRMVFEAKVGGIGDKKQIVSVPLTEVNEIMIGSDDWFYWHRENGRGTPKNDLETIKRLAEAVSKGKLPSGHHYRCNWVPSFGSTEE